ncbi:hypothetical protein LEMLEM_LOCUS21025 [Lemmus lemmus]
MGPMGW